jgi:hypothetical protein
VLRRRSKRLGGNPHGYAGIHATQAAPASHPIFSGANQTMQFGRVIGVGVAILGFMLILLEFGFYVNASKPELRRENERRDFDMRQRAIRSRHYFSALPGILGGVLVIGGAAIFLKARREDEPEPKNAIK